MQPYSTDIKTKIVHFYFETKSIVATQRKLRRHLKRTQVPSRTVILSIVEKFLARGSVENVKRVNVAEKEPRGRL